jgi:ABC-type transporter Mla maintaining outer membrane lipid asymmetry ATPase subunit MlaF
MREPLLALEDVTLQAPGGRVVFEHLDWRLEKGARHHLQAGLGVGATALLRLCAGLARPSRGRVLLDGTAPDPDTLAHPFVNLGALGWVPTDGGLAVNLTYLQNAALPLRFAQRMAREEAEALAGLWLERAGLAPDAGRRPRVPADRDSWLASLARAGAKGSKLWLVDRPAGGLDAASVRAARAILEQAARDPEATLLLVGGDWMAGLGEPLKIEDGRLASGSRP